MDDKHQFALFLMCLAVICFCMGCDKRESHNGDPDPFLLPASAKPALVQLCRKEAKQEPWLIYIHRHAIYCLLPPEQQSPMIRRGKAVKVRNEKFVEMQPYAQVAPLFSPFTADLAVPTNVFEAPFMLDGELSDYDLIRIWEFVRLHTICPRTKQDQQALAEIWQERQQSLTNIAGREMREALHLRTVRLDWHLAPASVADSDTFHWPVFRISAIQKERGNMSHMPQNKITVTMQAGTASNGQTIEVSYTNGSLIIVGGSEWVE